MVETLCEVPCPYALPPILDRGRRTSLPGALYPPADVCVRETEVRLTGRAISARLLGRTPSLRLIGRSGREKFILARLLGRES